MAKMRVEPKIFITIGDLAKTLEISAKTATRLCDQGHLQHWRIPGGLDRRILFSSVIEWAAKAGMPSEGIDHIRNCNPANLYCIGLSSSTIRLIDESFENLDYRVINLYEAGRILPTLCKPMILIDLANIGSDVVSQICDTVSSKAKIAVIAGEDITEQYSFRAKVIYRPLAPKALAKALDLRVVESEQPK